MKNFKFFAAFFTIVTLLGLTGCSDDQAELLNGGQGPNGSTILNVNYTIPGQDTKVFSATNVTADATDTTVTITAENDETGESLVMSFAGNKEQKEADPSYVASVTYIDANGNEYSALSPVTSKQTGAARLLDIDTATKTITGVFSLIGYDAAADDVTDGVPFFSGTFINVPYTGTLPEPDPTTTPGNTYMKATVDGTLINFATVSTLAAEGSTTFNGANATPMAMLQLIFFDDSVLVEGATLAMGEDADAQIIVGTSGYFANEGSVTITDITGNIVTGTFHFSASDIDDVETIEITAGEFKMSMQ